MEQKDEKVRFCRKCLTSELAEQADTFLIALRAGVIDKGNIRRAALLCLNRVFPEGAHTP